jgi:hypothetical protein
MVSLSETIDNYALYEKRWAFSFPDYRIDIRDIICYSYSRGCYNYDIYAYKEPDNEVRIVCYKNAEIVVDEVVISLEDFIDCLQVNDF